MSHDQTPNDPSARRRPPQRDRPPLGVLTNHAPPTSGSLAYSKERFGFKKGREAAPRDRDRGVSAALRQLGDGAGGAFACPLSPLLATFDPRLPFESSPLPFESSPLPFQVTSDGE
jgi:hypothetical protein